MDASIDLNSMSCIDACSDCHRICLRTALTYCIEIGGAHVDADHFRLMMNCAEICQTCANFHLSNSAYSNQLSAVCAVICDACADSCEVLGGMEVCVESCRFCAKNCRLSLMNTIGPTNSVI